MLFRSAHALKFAGFQDMYFRGVFPADYEIVPDPARANIPGLVLDQEAKSALDSGEFTVQAAQRVVEILGLSRKTI